MKALFDSEWPILWYEDIDSTNEEARRRAKSGDWQHCWIGAAKQSMGRGRRGRVWQSPVGNLFTTAYFPWEGSAELASKICFSAGLAVIDAAENVGCDTSAMALKWPNDVRVNQRKLCGILIETGQLSSDDLWIAAGIGVNVAMAPEADQLTTCLHALGAPATLDARAFLSVLAMTFQSRVSQLQEKGFSHVRIDWLEKSEGLGQEVVVTVGNDNVRGVMRDMDEAGALILDTAQGQKIITAGDVQLVKKD